ncbi:outer membrane beta-barrel protein [Bizionia myxarmorum]|uniref:Outer membrane beta-barrel protein n=1 Tax=Bizionia myxarmorum TaxID=291186 RepID=A0A5D0RDF2_9FLAO|nr:outer membrane beta-barrel protein [Bizionia myxarmorum]TYB79059.1 outer membrane beta-barrel protein [Bizionia myxarmorum]
MNFRKSFILVAFLSLFALQISAQEEPHFKIVLGLNAIDNSNSTSQAPWGIDDVAFNTPLYVGADYQINSSWSFGANASFNKLKELGVESNFFGVNADVNYYIVSNTARSFIDFYGIVGGGAYKAFGGTGITVNPGLGFNYWFADNFGVNLTAKANFDLTSNVSEVGNFYKYSLGLIWRPTQRF